MTHKCAEKPGARMKPTIIAAVLTVAVATIHVLASFILIVLVLLHSGKGGGVSDMFGGGVSSSAAGSTVANRNLDRATVALVLIWASTTIALAIRLQ